MSAESFRQLAVSQLHDVSKKYGLSITSICVLYMAMRYGGVSREDLVKKLADMTDNHAGVILHRLKNDGFLVMNQNELHVKDYMLGRYTPTKKCKAAIDELTS